MAFAESISILDLKVKPSAMKKISRDDAVYLSGRVRSIAAASNKAWTVMSKENIEQILKDSNKDYAECASSAEGACEVGVGRILASDYHVAGDVSAIGSHFVALSIRLYDVHSGKLIDQEDFRGVTSDQLIERVDSLAKALFSSMRASGPASPAKVADGRDAPKVPAAPAPVDPPSSFRDPRDGRSYRTTRIGSQVWMADNLDYKMGDSSWCYDQNPSNCSRFGSLYPWKAAMHACPDGWHLPSEGEWLTLLDAIGAQTVVDQDYTYYKSRRQVQYGAANDLKDEGGWSRPDEPALSKAKRTNKYGFNMSASGWGGPKEFRDGYRDAQYYEASFYWTSTKYGCCFPYYWMFFSSGGFSGTGGGEGIFDNCGKSVRCLKD